MAPWPGITYSSAVIRNTHELATEVVPADDDGIARAVHLLRQGQVVALPTETVYGLAADARNGEAVARIYAAKGRPSFNPLIVHVAGIDMAEPLVHFSATARQLAERFWPGPLTLVLSRHPHADISSLVTAGLPTLAVRVPAHPVPQLVLSHLGRGIAAPSANPSGRLSPTTARHVLTGLHGRIPLIVDGGTCPAGVESTIVAVVGNHVRLLRPGALAIEDLGVEVDMGDSAEAAIQAPGMMASHYAPAQPIRLDVVTPAPEEYHIGFGPVAGHVSLSASGDLVEAAARLFDVLHMAQDSGAPAIAVAPIPGHGLGRALNDRLARAAAPRG